MTGQVTGGRTDHPRGGFPDWVPVTPAPGFARFLAAMRRAQDLAVSADADPDGWDRAADLAQRLVDELAPYEAAEGIGPAHRAPSMPGMGSLLMPPYVVEAFDDQSVTVRVRYGRYHVGGNQAVHGGVLPLLFDAMFGMLIHVAERPNSRTAFLHVDYRKVTPIDVDLSARGWVDRVDGRKTFVCAELRDADGALLTESHGLMVALRPGQP